MAGGELVTGAEFLLWLKPRVRRRGACLLWRGACPGGSPQTRHPEHQERVQVRRLVLEMGGHVLSPETLVVQSCKHERCVYAGHLRAASISELRRSRPARTHCKKGHPFDLHNGRNRCITCRADYYREHPKPALPWAERRTAPATGELTDGQRSMLNVIRASNRLGLPLSLTVLNRMLFPGRKGHDSTGRNLRALEARGLVETARLDGPKSPYVSIVAVPG